MWPTAVGQYCYLCMHFNIPPPRTPSLVQRSDCRRTFGASARGFPFMSIESLGYFFPLRDSRLRCFLLSEPTLYQNLWSLIPKPWQNLVLDPTKMVQPDPWSLKKVLIPIPLASALSQGCQGPRSHRPFHTWSRMLPRYDPNSKLHRASTKNGLSGLH